MKFFHISDIHIGKRVNGFSMLEDQRYILRQITELVRQEKPDGILIAGDLYDRPMPSAEAVELADQFLYQLTAEGVPVWVISGNHDCAERIAYGSRMLEQAGLYMARVFDGTVQQYTLESREGEESTQADIYLLPYIRPAQVRRFFPEQVIETTQQAVKAILDTVQLNPDRSNILVMHQFLAGASVCESEELTVGGSDQVDASLVDDFDYVALGHLHGPQRVGKETVRYCGSPLKYSFSEAGHEKSVTVVTIANGQVEVGTLPLTPRLDLREVRGPMAQLLTPEVVQAADPLDYLHITLTDQKEILDAIGKLRQFYPNIMRLDFESAQADGVREQEILIEEKTPMELFEEFFVQQNGYAMTEEQRIVAEEIWKKGGEADEA